MDFVGVIVSSLFVAFHCFGCSFRYGTRFFFLEVSILAAELDPASQVCERYVGIGIEWAVRAVPQIST